jgi:5'-3' exonuclease
VRGARARAHGLDGESLTSTHPHHTHADRVHISEYTGLIVAVDGYTWVHKAVYTCAQQLATGGKSEAWIKFCETRLGLLLHHGVKPFFVFDGANLPAKAAVEDKRKADRAAALQTGLDAAARKDHNAAQLSFSRAVDVSPSLVHQWLKLLRARGIPFVVAPYEADAQLAYLYRTAQCAAVLTEDSDLIPFGVGRVLFKMDKEGYGQEIQRSSLARCEELSFASWNDEMVLSWCILSGCDYLENPPGMAGKRAHSHVAKYGGGDVMKLLQMLKLDEKLGPLPADYSNRFKLARLTFLHQRVFDPVSRKLTTVTPIPAKQLEATSAEFWNFLGPAIPDELAAAIADGFVDPTTRLPYEGAGEASAIEAGAGAGTAPRLRKPPALPWAGDKSKENVVPASLTISAGFNGVGLKSAARKSPTGTRGGLQPSVTSFFAVGAPAAKAGAKAFTTAAAPAAPVMPPRVPVRAPAGAPTVSPFFPSTSPAAGWLSRGRMQSPDIFVDDSAAPGGGAQVLILADRGEEPSAVEPTTEAFGGVVRQPSPTQQAQLQALHAFARGGDAMVSPSRPALRPRLSAGASKLPASVGASGPGEVRAAASKRTREFESSLVGQNLGPRKRGGQMRGDVEGGEEGEEGRPHAPTTIDWNRLAYGGGGGASATPLGAGMRTPVYGLAAGGRAAAGRSSATGSISGSMGVKARRSQGKGGLTGGDMSATGPGPERADEPTRRRGERHSSVSPAGAGATGRSPAPRQLTSSVFASRSRTPAMYDVASPAGSSAGKESGFIDTGRAMVGSLASFAFGAGPAPLKFRLAAAGGAGAARGGGLNWGGAAREEEAAVGADWDAGGRLRVQPSVPEGMAVTSGGLLRFGRSDTY